MHSQLHHRQAKISATMRTKLAGSISAMLLLASCASNDIGRPAEVETRDVRPTGQEQFDETGDATAIDLPPTLTATDIDEGNEAAHRASRAEYYQRRAQSQADQTARIDSILSSAEYYVQANQHQRAEELVLSISDLPPSGKLRDRATVILAYRAYSIADYSGALNILYPLTLDASLQADPEGTQLSEVDPSLTSPETPEPAFEDPEETSNEPIYLDTTLPSKTQLSTQQVDALLLASFCHQALNDYASAIDVLLQREASLYGKARSETTRYIWQVINGVPIAEREILLQSATNSLVRNRIAQSLEGQIGAAPDTPKQFNQWRDEATYGEPVVVASEWGPDSPRSVYVLLPLSSRFSKAAQAVKDGIELEHANNQSVYRPQLSFYDVGDNPLQITQFYAAAVRSGADFIIGPLGRDFSNEVNINNQIYGRRAPMLMLGGDRPLNSGNLRLRMGPEMEGERIAERAWRDGHLSAGLLMPNTANAKRTANAFVQRWLSLGGKLSNTIEYSPQQYDHSVELKRLFNVNLSQYRHRQLSQTLGFKPKFSAYQRADIDFVFMLADDKTGRIVRPQINFFTNSQLPVYATSAVFNGIQDKVNNMDLDNTEFPVMPWVLRSQATSQYAGQLNMLYALGMDAYRVAGNLNGLRSSQSAVVNGNTGQLELQRNGEIIFQPVWARFTEGEAQVRDDMGLNLSPISDTELEDASQLNEQGTYNNENWDSRQSRRKTGG